MNVNIFTKTTRVVIAYGFRVSKSYEKDNELMEDKWDK